MALKVVSQPSNMGQITGVRNSPLGVQPTLKVAPVQQPRMAPGVIPAPIGQPQLAPGVQQAPSNQPQITSVGTATEQSPFTPKLTMQEFAQKVKQKYPVYSDRDDTALAQAVLAKYPQYQSKVFQTSTQTTPEKQQGFVQRTAQAIASPFARLATTAAGAVEGAGQAAKAVYYKATGDEEKSKEAVRRGLSKMDEYERGVNLGYLGNVKAVTKPKDALGVGAELASNFIGFSGVGAVGKGVFKGAVAQAAKQGFKTGALGGFVAGTGLGLQSDKSIGQSLKQGLYTGAVSAPLAAVLGATGATASKIIRETQKFISPTVKQSLVQAIKPAKNNLNFTKDMDTALPEIVHTAQTKGMQVKNLDDLAQVTLESKKGLWGLYERLLGANKAQTIDGNKIANAMVATIDKRTRTQNPALVERITQTAATYRRKLTLGEAEEFLQSANNDLYSFYAKNKVGRKVAIGDPEKAFVVREAEALRDLLYSKFDDIGSPEARLLKQKYGALSNVEKEVLGRKNVAARQASESLSEQLSYASGIGKVVKSTFNMQFGDALEGTAQIAGARYLKQRNTADALIERAFSKLNKSVNYVEKTPFVRSTRVAIPQAPKTLLGLPAPKPGAVQSQVNVPMNMPTRIRPVDKPFTGKGALSRINDYLNEIPVGLSTKSVSKADDLVAEAKKFPTAEEFVKAQGQSVFRGGDTAIDTSRGGSRGISVSDKETAELFTSPKGGVVDEAILPKTAKVLKEGDIPKNLQDAYIKEAKVLADPNNFSSTLQKSVIEKQQAITDYARKNGFDAVEFPFEKEIRVVKPNVLKTKSQLTDIWNKAQQGKLGKRVPKRIDLPTKQEMVEVIDYVRLNQPYSQRLEENAGLLAEKFGLTPKSLHQLANEFVKLIENTGGLGRTMAKRATQTAGIGALAYGLNRSNPR